MSNDKLRDAVKEAYTKLTGAIESDNWAESSQLKLEGMTILRELVQQFKPEFWLGQHVLLDYSDSPGTKAIIIGEERFGLYKVAYKDEPIVNTIETRLIKSDPDWSPPGYIKNPGYDNIEMEVKKEIDYWFENTERNFWELRDLITNKVFSLWPDESEGE